MVRIKSLIEGGGRWGAIADIFDEVFPMVQAAANLTASQFHRPEFKWLSGRRGCRRCCGYAFAALADSVSICIVNELLSPASMRDRIETRWRRLRSICSCDCKRTIGEDGCAAGSRDDVRVVQ